MKKATKRISAIVSVALVISLSMVLASGIYAADRAGVMESTPSNTSIHEKTDISEITGEIAEPPELTSAASAIAAEKAWYEYVYYSPEPVGRYYLNDNTRISFYDPYDYASSLIMEVDDSLTDWSSNNSMQISYTTGDSMTDTNGKSTETVTTTLYGYTDTQTTNTSENTVTTKINNNTKAYNTSKTVSTVDNYDWSLSETVGAETGEDFPLLGTKISASLEVGSNQHWTKGTTTTGVEGDIKDEDGNVMTGYTTSDNTTSVTTGPQTTTITNTIADRTTSATGYSTNSTITLSTNNSTTITKTYDAGYFNPSGAPLQWKIIKYTVIMPMKYQIEYLVDDEWVFGDYNYCLLTTIQGTCRAWLQNSQAYYEHWGTGEAVTWDEFWAQFFTEESLIQAYQNKLYPDN